ncbi:hypothetical protein RND81_03G121600 [Saponaria officinalis]|uniref:Uncharacterized protein n=1 Tax=Saponaria officinalis TaxID=3572 RepID=A0AAW1M005_SAPOF
MEQNPSVKQDQQQKPNKTHEISPSNLQKDQTFENIDKQIVLYNPQITSNDVIFGNNKEIIPIPDPGPECEPDPERVVLPSVGAFTVQCAACYKWRLIPSKRKYEEIREHIMELPFSCDVARQWRADISCDDASDVDQDGGMLWAIDKPSIAQTPLGWERELRIRGRGSYKFADVYYISPTGKRLRSIVEVRKYLMEHPELTSQGATLSRFSFQIPKPLQKNYLRKKTTQSNASSGETVQDDSAALQLGGPSISASYSRDDFNDVTPPVEKKPQSSPKHTFSSDLMHNETHTFEVK